MTAELPDGLLAELRAAVGGARVLTGDVTAGQAVDWTGRFVGWTPAVVRPASTAEVAAVLAACDRAGVAVVPQGGNTGLVGGGVPLHGEVVLDLRHLDQLDPVDVAARQVTAGAGVTLARLAAHARAAGLRYAVDLAARDTATVGGTIATNAGGLHVLRWGTTRAQVLGVEAVLADGRVVSHLGGLAKDNTGYDLAGLLCGSEGTLAVVTAARLRLVPEAPARATALVGLPTLEAAVALTAAVEAAVPTLEAAEVMLAAGVALVADRTGAALPFPELPSVLVLLEAADRIDPTSVLADAVAGALVTAGAAPDAPVAVAPDEVARRRLWALREEHTTAINALGPPHKLDVTLPRAALASVVADLPAVVAAVVPEARTWVFGHLGDGNVHINVTGADPGDVRVDDAVLTRVAAAGGSISAEHGIGAAKRRWLHLNRSPEELAAFRALKGALDPHGTLNPHVLLPEA